MFDIIYERQNGAKRSLKTEQNTSIQKNSKEVKNAKAKT